jgi:hypothetical protein
MNRKHESNELKMNRVEVYRGDKITPDGASRDCVVLLRIVDPNGQGNSVNSELTLGECNRLINFLVAAREETCAATTRAHCIAHPEMSKAPNLCKSCGHLNDPDKRGWCLCEHCDKWMDRGPFPGQSLEDHEAQNPFMDDTKGSTE